METPENELDLEPTTAPHSLGKLIEWKHLQIISLISYTILLPTRWGN